LEIKELRQFDTRIDADVYHFLSLEGSLASRAHVGGTAPERVRESLTRARRLLQDL
jgi:argininosuccinate lyase